MSHELVASSTDLAAEMPPFAMLPWRDPQTVPPGEVAIHIEALEQLCAARPESADLRTCLGLAHAVNYDVYRAMDALEAARAIDPFSFWAQLKYAEIQYRLRALNLAEAETLKAVDLARTPWQLSLARRQLSEIRRLRHDSARNVEWTKPLAAPVAVLSLIFLVVFVVMLWK